MKLYNYRRKRKESKNYKRFYTQLDMAILKHDIAVRNSKVKRGEIVATNTEGISVCGCGAEGCFMHYYI